VPGEVRAAYEKSLKTGIKPNATEWLHLLCSTIKMFSVVFIVVDALDEYEQDLRNTFLHLMQSLPPGVRLLYTSRYLLDIETIIDSDAKIEIRATNEDLKLYLEENMQNGGRLQSHITKDPLLKDKIVETVIKKAQGMYVVLS